MALYFGETLDEGKYRIVQLIGRGGFGNVYLAEDVHLRELVAIKELIPALVDDEKALRRFLTEAKASRQLRHPHIVGTYHLFPERGNYYIVMEYLEGGSLEAQLDSSELPGVQEAVRIAAEVANGLAHAHACGVIHCDLKPANVLMTVDGHAKVADFGIAHVSTPALSRSWATAEHAAVGTLAYMSPEQTQGIRDDPRIDVYALGAMLFRMLTGHSYLEFEQDASPAAFARSIVRIQTEAPPSPSALNFLVPSWLCEVVLKALAKQPDERFSTVSEFAVALIAPPTVKGGRVAPARMAATENTVVKPLRLGTQPETKARSLGVRVQPTARAVPGNSKGGLVLFARVPLYLGGLALVVVLVLALKPLLDSGSPSPTPAATTAPSPTTGSISAETKPEPTGSPSASLGASDVQDSFDYLVVAGDNLASIASKFGVTVDGIASLNGIGDPNGLTLGQVLKIPGHPPSQGAVSTPTPDLSNGESFYIVQSGDTLGRIAQRFNTTAAELARINGMSNPDGIKVGQRLRVPGTVSAAPTEIRPGSTEPRTHVMQSGETLGMVAKRYGVTVAQIQAANNISNPDRTYVGQRLIIP